MACECVALPVPFFGQEKIGMKHEDSWTDWLADVQERIRRKNQVLFQKQDMLLSELSLELRRANHRAVVLWALEWAEKSVEILRAKYPQENRPQAALEGAWLWASGEIKMREAQKKILQCHALAKEIHSREDIALCHAVGQACSTVHTPGHAMGYPMYDLTSLVCHYGIECCKEPVEARVLEYLNRLKQAEEQEPKESRQWATFLVRDRMETSENHRGKDDKTNH